MDDYYEPCMQMELQYSIVFTYTLDIIFTMAHD